MNNRMDNRRQSAQPGEPMACSIPDGMQYFICLAAEWQMNNRLDHRRQSAQPFGRRQNGMQYSAWHAVFHEADE